jgi:hypothetical protein
MAPKESQQLWLVHAPWSTPADVQVNYGHVEESALNFVIKQSCDNYSVIWGGVFKHDGRGRSELTVDGA